MRGYIEDGRQSLLSQAYAELDNCANEKTGRTEQYNLVFRKADEQS